MCQLQSNLEKNENKRKWTPLINAGALYTITSNLLGKYFFCNICKEEIQVMVDMKELEKSKSEDAALHQNERCTFHNLF